MENTANEESTAIGRIQLEEDRGGDGMLLQNPQTAHLPETDSGSPAARQSSQPTSDSSALHTDSYQHASYKAQTGIENDGQAANTSSGSAPSPSSPFQTSGDYTKLSEQVWAHERERVKRWRNEINSLLTFAGLFAAVITGFGVQYYGILQPPSDSNMQVLLQILHQIEVIANHTTNGSSQTTFLAQSLSDDSDTPPTYIATLWFASLVLGLSAASIAILVNQWLNNLLTPTALSGNGSHEQLRIWNLRHQTFRTWRLAALIDIPSVLLQIALLLFLIGLVGYLWQLNTDVAIPITVLFLLLFLFLLSTTFIAVFVSYTPFISPQSKFLCWVSLLLKLSWYAIAFRFADWLSDQAMLRNIYIMDEDDAMKLYHGISARRATLQAIRAYGGYYSWAAGESMYLRTEAGRMSDDTIVANMLPVTKDGVDSAIFLELFLKVMRPQKALRNVISMCKRRPLSLPDDEGTPWRRGAEPQNKFITAGVKFARCFLAAGGSKIATDENEELPSLQAQAIKAYEAALVALRSDQTGRAVYLQLFALLKEGGITDIGMQLSVLDLIYRLDDDADTAKWSEDDVMCITSWAYTGDTDACVVMTYTAVTLMLLGELDSRSQGGLLQINRWHYVEEMLKKFARHSLPARDDSTEAAGPWELPSWSEACFTNSIMHLTRLAYSIRETSGLGDTGSEQRLAVLEQILVMLKRIKDHIDDADFRIGRTFWSFGEVMDMAQAAKGKVESETKQQSSKDAHSRAQEVESTDMVGSLPSVDKLRQMNPFGRVRHWSRSNSQNGTNSHPPDVEPGPSQANTSQDNIVSKNDVEGDVAHPDAQPLKTPSRS